MEHSAFEGLVAKVNGCFFSSSKRETINKSPGPFSAQQIYRLQGQFTNGGDRVQVLSDLNASKKILPMTAKDAEPIIKMGIYSGQRRDILTKLVPYITDRQHLHARQLLTKTFSGADNTWMVRELDQAGPYQGPPPVATITGAGTAIITNSVIVASPGMHYQPDPVSYAGNMLFGGLVSAEVPNTGSVVGTAVATPVVYPGQQVYYPQQQNNYQMTAVVPPPVAYPQPAMYSTPPTQPTQSRPTAASGGGVPYAPPAYTPVDTHAYHHQYPENLQNNMMYPPLPNEVPPEKAPVP